MWEFIRSRFLLHQPNSSTTDIWTLIIHNALSFKIHCRKPLKSSKDSGLKCNLSYAKENQIHFAFNEKTNILHAVLHPPVIVRLGSKCAYIPSSSSVPILQTGSSSGELLTGTIKSWQLRRIRVLSLMRQSGPAHPTPVGTYGRWSDNRWPFQKARLFPFTGVCFADCGKCFIFQGRWFAVSIECYHPAESAADDDDAAIGKTVRSMRVFRSGPTAEKSDTSSGLSAIHHRTKVWKFNWFKMTWHVAGNGAYNHRGQH